MDKKKVIYVVIGVVLVIGIGISYYLTARPSTQPTQGPQTAIPSAADNATNQTGTSGQTTQAGSTNPTGPTSTPEEITKTFYDWYMNYPTDVVATGAYKTSPYLTAKFIANIDGFARNYTPKFDPIFCTPNKTKQYAISKTIGTGDPNKIKVQITNLNVDNPKPLYDVIIVLENGALKIDDIMCD